LEEIEDGTADEKPEDVAGGGLGAGAWMESLSRWRAALHFEVHSADGNSANSQTVRQLAVMLSFALHESQRLAQ
jgi:hypothetical protein